MTIHIVTQRATEKEISEMLEELKTYIELAVDVERNILARGGKWNSGADQYSSTPGKPIDGN